MMKLYIVGFDKHGRNATIEVYDTRNRKQGTFSISRKCLPEGSKTSDRIEFHNMTRESMEAKVIT